MNIRLSPDAELDLARGADFYNEIREGLGTYFNDCLASDIDSLQLYAGIHAKIGGYYFTVSERFPFAIYYNIEREFIVVYAILDCREEPSVNERRLQDRGLER